jgi:hypothetical protein
MSQEEKREFDRLSEQLTDAQSCADETRALFLTSLNRTSGELRLYRGLFWSLLAFTFITTICSLLRS